MMKNSQCRVTEKLVEELSSNGSVSRMTISGALIDNYLVVENKQLKQDHSFKTISLVNIMDKVQFSWT